MARQRVERIVWQQPRRFSSWADFYDLKGITGVYVVYSDESWWEYEDEDRDEIRANAIAYIGHGDVGTRLSRHSNLNSRSGDPDLKAILKEHENDDETMWVIWAPAKKQIAECAEDQLLEQFEDIYEDLPPSKQGKKSLRSQ